MIILSNKSKWQLTDKLCTLPLFKMSYIALDAFSANILPLIDGKQSKWSSLIYRLLYLKTHGNNTFSWINLVKSILDDCGYSNIWHTQNSIRHKWLIESTLQNLDTVIYNENCHQSRKIDIADTVYCVFLHLSSALLQSVIYD
jgi:hypothetical protein